MAVQTNTLVEKGKWQWNEETNKLTFQKQGKYSRRKSRAWMTPPSLVIKESLIPTQKTAIISSSHDRVITLEDVKAVAVGLIDSDVIQKMKKSTCRLFDECYRTEHMNSLLWAILVYFNTFMEHEEAKNDQNLLITDSLGDKAREKLGACQKRLTQSRVNLGHIYSLFILGLGHTDSHHTKGGRLKVSRTHTDQGLYEAIYEFAMYVTWVTFGYKDWKLIHQELGRILRTSAFNRDFGNDDDDDFIEIESFGAIIDKDSEEYLSYRIYFDRPPVGSLKGLRSPVMTTYLPSAKEKQPWLFEYPYSQPPRNPQEHSLPVKEILPPKLGIIGEQLSDYDPETLHYIERSDDEDETSSEEEGDDGLSQNDSQSQGRSESEVSGIIEDDGEGGDDF